jgi:hypothetical protein
MAQYVQWVDLTDKHSRKATDYFLKELRPDRVQVDEIWSYIRKEKNFAVSDSKECGDIYSLTAV